MTLFRRTYNMVYRGGCICSRVDLVLFVPANLLPYIISCTVIFQKADVIILCR